MKDWVWTNRSVALMAGDDDPVEAISKRARDLVLDALDHGWSGPPFDPFTLADRVGVDVVARSDIRDARTVPVGRGENFRIEFNPSRPPARVRYSIAHEIAHTLFPDCAEEVRHRAARTELHGDDWQLEALCNVAAAEFLMPLGSFPDLREESITIDRLVELRREYAVSTEALLIRAARLVDVPLAVFAASRIESGGRAGSYRLEYLIPSSSWTEETHRRAVLGPESIPAQCTGIGFTAVGEESWPGWGLPHRVECVGLPPYPGSHHPRVAGVVRADATNGTGPTFEIVKGDATLPRGRPAIVAHIVNNRTANWGGRGFARAVRHKWEAVQEDFQEWAQGGLRLGETRISDAQPGLWVASMIAQSGYGPSPRPRIRYAALRTALAAVGGEALRRNATVHMPRIGTGEAGGDWTIVQDLVREECVRRGVSVIVYDLPDVAVSTPDQPSLSLFDS